MRRWLNSWLCSIGIAALLSGCGGEAGPEMGEVSGLVKLDGQPLANARITFVPDTAGKPDAQASTAVAVTDAEGRYELEYSSTRSGAAVGPYIVRISTHREVQEDDEGNETPAAPETVPAEYNIRAATNPDMKREVKPGSNELNFDLKSGGQIIQPPRSDDD